MHLVRGNDLGGAAVAERAAWAQRSCRALVTLMLGVLLTGMGPSYEREVRPLLKRRCLGCHGEQPELAGGLDLRLRRTAVAGGDSGPAIEPGNAAASLLMEQVVSQAMPPGDVRKLSQEEIDLLQRWIAAGALTDDPEPNKLPPPGEPFITAADRHHWSLLPIRSVLPSKVASEAQGSTSATSGFHADAMNGLDLFIGRELREHGLSFAAPADRRTLIRRLYFDLLGLPPSPEEIERFLADDAADAWERLVDRVLASPHYGERWARHWLDVVHFGETH
ncbi:MAG: DUF1549 domain-containing protein, partial [Planctomycetaceae bacterium]|nr:DUF1549 domain-containing protein [Planctomycetaceae bacterium]